MKALILSGGTGTRLRPLTYSMSKQLIPVANKPILFYVIEKIADAGIKDIGIVVGDTFSEIIGSTGNGGRWNADITYIRQQEPLGLAHAVKISSDFLAGDEFVMVLGDNLFEMELAPLIVKFRESGANAALLLHRVSDPSRYGIAVVDGDNIIRLIEKPKDYIGDLAITGVYIFDGSIFPAIELTVPSPRGELEITDAMQKLLDMGGKLTYRLTSGWWKDTGKLEDLLEVNRLLMEKMEHCMESLPEDTKISGPLVVAGGAQVRNCIIQGPAIIGSGSSVSNSWLGPYSSIGYDTEIQGCSIEDSIVLNGSRLSNVPVKIKSSLIGKNSLVEGNGSGPVEIGLFVGEGSVLRI